MAEWNREPTPTSLTAGHRILSDILFDLGLRSVDEQKVGVYSIDCFVEECWLGFEADGRRTHAGKRKRERDSNRDAWILEHAGIPILRIPNKKIERVRDRETTKKEIMIFVDEWNDSAEERRIKGTWIL